MKSFEDYIYETYSNHNKFEEIKHGFSKINTAMMQHVAYKNASEKSKFDICVTCYLIVNQTLLQHLNENRPIRPKKEIQYKYSISNGFRLKEVLEIGGNKNDIKLL